MSAEHGSGGEAGCGQPGQAFRRRLGYLERALRRRGEEAASLAAGGTAAEGVARPRADGSPDGPRRQGAEGRPAGAEPRFWAEHDWERSGEFTLHRRLRFDNFLEGQSLSEFLLPPGYALSDLLFFDTETTGLSGGAGTFIFLLGTARFEAEELRVEQLFLRDFPGEAEFLGQVADLLAAGRLFISYNGRAFDAPLLRTRFLLNRLELVLEEQRDLLYWARRLWRRSLSDCSLGTVEREILGISRQADVPGFEVPAIYLQYLRSGLLGRLELVLEHNLQDVLSLARLYSAINRNLTGGTTCAGSDPALVRTDRYALGSFLIGRNRQWGVELLKEAHAAGDEAAGRSLSLYYKRRGDWPAALALWHELLDRRRSLFAALELAKYYEHRSRQPETALELVRSLLSWNLPLDRQARLDLAHRYERLKRKTGG